MTEGDIHTAWYCCFALLHEAVEDARFFARIIPNYVLEPEYMRLLAAGLEDQVMAAFQGFPENRPSIVIEVKKGTKNDHSVAGTQFFYFAPEEGVFYEIDTARWATLLNEMVKKRVFHRVCSRCLIEHKFIVWVTGSGSPRTPENEFGRDSGFFDRKLKA
jgi:hypothetical protein